MSKQPKMIAAETAKRQANRSASMPVNAATTLVKPSVYPDDLTSTEIDLAMTAAIEGLTKKGHNGIRSSMWATPGEIIRPSGPENHDTEESRERARMICEEFNAKHGITDFDVVTPAGLKIIRAPWDRSPQVPPSRGGISKVAGKSSLRPLFVAERTTPRVLSLQSSMWSTPRNSMLQARDTPSSKFPSPNARPSTPTASLKVNTGVTDKDSQPIDAANRLPTHSIHAGETAKTTKPVEDLTTTGIDDTFRGHKVRSPHYVPPHLRHVTKPFTVQKDLESEIVVPHPSQHTRDMSTHSTETKPCIEAEATISQPTGLRSEIGHKSEVVSILSSKPTDAVTHESKKIPPHLRSKHFNTALNDQSLAVIEECNDTVASGLSISPAINKSNHGSIKDEILPPHLRSKYLNGVKMSTLLQSPNTGNVVAVQGSVPSQSQSSVGDKSAASITSIPEKTQTNARSSEAQAMNVAQSKARNTDLCGDFAEFMRRTKKVKSQTTEKPIMPVSLSLAPLESESQTIVKEKLRPITHKNHRMIHKALMQEINAPTAPHQKGLKSIPEARALSLGSEAENETGQDNLILPRPQEDCANLKSLDEAVPKFENVQDPRMMLAEEPTELADWTGIGFGPLPLSWEHDRPGLNGTFMPAYIQVWGQNISPLPADLNIRESSYLTGEYHACGDLLEPPPAYPVTYPCIDSNHRTDLRRISSTAETASQAVIRRIHKNNLAKEHLEATSSIPIVDYDFADYEDPNAPKMELYLRPAEHTDAIGIAKIYNHYATNSIVPEDQQVVTSEFICSLITKAKHDFVPFVVALKGLPPPPPPRPQPKYFGKRIPLAQPKQPEGIKSSEELVIGFSMVECAAGTSAFGGKGRSRLTAKLHFYTHPEHLRKGVGRCVLDRTLSCISSVHCSINGYPWINKNENPVYQPAGGFGPRRFHQVLLERAVEHKDDPDYEWLKPWLEKKFYFVEVCRLVSVARSSTVGAARFLDVIQFQFEAVCRGEFSIFM